MRNISFAGSCCSARENKNRLANVKKPAHYFFHGAAWGWALRSEKIHVVDGEGRIGRRSVKLRLVECFGAGKFRTMAEGWRLFVVQRRRGAERHRAMDRR